MIEYIAHHGLQCRVLARRHGPADLARNPRIAWDERAVLTHLREHDFPAPTVAGIPGVVRSGIFPTPVLFTEFIEGATTPSDPDHAIRAGILLGWLHTLPLHARLRNLPRLRPRVLNVALERDSPLAGRAVEAANALLPNLTKTTTKVLLHGDYWPGNLLWDEHDAVHVIDWEDAAIGDPRFDLANARLEWRLAYGVDEAEYLTEGYCLRRHWHELHGLPWFDLNAAIRLERKLGSFGLETAVEQRWRAEINAFVDEAIATADALRRA